VPLLLVSTPIGNLGDLPPRAVEALRAADLIAAEDTRRTGNLLQTLGFSAPMISYHQHNRVVREPLLLEKLTAGQTIALVSDAGMPLISDPGESLVAACVTAGVAVTVIPGPNAALCGLLLSGLPCDRFAFEGFLPIKKAELHTRLEALRTDPRTLIFYEAPHRIAKTLEAFCLIFGPRPAALARELTKLHEEVLRLPLPDLAEAVRQTPPRGELVLVVGGCPVQEKTVTEEALRQALQQARAEMPLKEASAAVAKAFGVSARSVYQLGLKK